MYIPSGRKDVFVFVFVQHGECARHAGLHTSVIWALCSICALKPLSSKPLKDNVTIQSTFRDQVGSGSVGRTLPSWWNMKLLPECCGCCYFAGRICWFNLSWFTCNQSVEAPECIRSVVLYVEVKYYINADVGPPPQPQECCCSAIFRQPGNWLE